MIRREIIIKGYDVAVLSNQIFVLLLKKYFMSERRERV